MISSNYMPRPYWLESLENLKEMLKIVSKHPKRIGQISTFLKEKDGDQYYKEEFIYDTLCTQFEILDNEIFKSFKNTEHGSLVNKPFFLENKKNESILFLIRNTLRSSVIWVLCSKSERNFMTFTKLMMIFQMLESI